MVMTFFIMGLLTSIFCGWNVAATSRTTGFHELAWVIGGTVGAAMMFGAIYVDRIVP